MFCEECNLSNIAGAAPSPASGNPKADIMIINSYAGELDEERGVATMPPYLVDSLKNRDIDPNRIYYTNLVKCSCPRGTKYKVGDVNRCYKKWMMEEIDKVSPRYMLLLGAQAVKAILGESISQVNGQVFERSGVHYLPAYNPSIIFRDPGKTQAVEHAMTNFRDMVNGEIKEPPQLNIRLITKASDIKKLERYLIRQEPIHFSFDIESTGLDRFTDDINLVGFGNTKVQFIIPCQAKFSPLRGRRMVQRYLIQECIKLVNQYVPVLVAGNGKFDGLFIRYHHGVKFRLDFDLVLASHCLNENTPNGVKENAIVELNAHNWEIPLEHKKGNYKTYDEYLTYLEYLGYDIYYEDGLYSPMKKKLKKDPSLNKLFYHLYMPGIHAYEEIEWNGVPINTAQFKKVRRKLETDIAEVEGQLNKMVRKKAKGRTINWNSPQQVGEVLYGWYKLPVLEYTEGGNPSTSESTLKQLSAHHELPRQILKYRAVHIQISHFIDGWINRMHGGKLYPNFKLHGTVTGRTSCTDPNLQQVPRDPIIRNLIAAPPGYSIVEVDYSQAELRIAAILSGDESMKRIYRTGGDIHTHTFELVSGETISEEKHEKKEQRKKAKAVNFGFVYGMGWRKFLEYSRDTYDVIITEAEAKAFRQKFFEAYHELPAWHTKQKRIVKAIGQVRNPIGRIRRLPDIYSSDQGKRAEAERQAINSPVQGFGSDYTILGMSEVVQTAKIYTKKYQLDKTKFYTIGTVHDATLFVVKNSYLYHFCETVKKVFEAPRAMAQVFHFTPPIPMVADVTVGPCWGSGIELYMDDEKVWKGQIKDYLKGAQDG